LIGFAGHRKIAHGALAAVALLGVVFPGLAPILHDHHGHVADDCDLCLQLAHLVFALADGGPTPDQAAVSDWEGVAGYAWVVAPSPAGDPARAPPVFS
jgi:hypothetical protein